MTNQNNHSPNFWFGFAVGATAATAAAYLLGTKKGRQTLKKVLDLSENLEEQQPELIEGIHEIINNVIESQGTPHHHAGEKEGIIESVINNSLENVMDKIKSVGQQKNIRKFFAKSGKIIDP